MSYWMPATEPVVQNVIEASTGNVLTSIYWHYQKVAIDETVKGIRATATVTGAATSLAVFYDAAGTRISTYGAGVNGVKKLYQRRDVPIPAGARAVAVCGSISKPVYIELLKPRKAIGRTVAAAVLPYWQGKTAVWFGTSIPAGDGSGSYPDIVGRMLDMTVINEAVGGSALRRGVASIATPDDPYGWTGQPWTNVAYSLTMSLAEKNELITNWESKWRDRLASGSGKPTTLDAETQFFIRDCAYENKLVARHLGANRKDLYILDHCHNDHVSSVIATGSSDVAIPPTLSRDRGYFLGAAAFFIDKILSDNPRARIFLIGPYENARKGEIAQALLALAEYWDFPLFKLWKKLGWSQQLVTSGGVTKTITQWWMSDDLHSHSDTTGGANELIAGVLAPWIRDNR
jgi:hypothetical protein